MEFSSVLSPPAANTPKTFEDFILLRFEYALRGRHAEVLQLDSEISSRFGRHCVVLIVKLHYVPHDYLSSKSSLLLSRELFRKLAAVNRGTFVKMVDNVLFLLFDSAVDALRVCCSAQAFSRLRNKGRPDKAQLHFTAGAQVGPVLVIVDRGGVSDFFGDPVNVASKLAEDIGLRDQLLLSPEVERLVARHFERDLTFVPTSCVVSGVEIPHVVVHGTLEDDGLPSEADLVRSMCPDPKLPDFELPLDELVGRALAAPSSSEKVRKLIDQRLKRSMPVLVSDMAGFTRITKSEGIQFCLMLIFKMRTILRPIIAKQRGDVINIIADDFVVVFPTAETCVTAAVEAREALENFNRMIDRRFHIIVHFALGFGDLVTNSAPFASVVYKELFGPEFETTFELGENIAEGQEILLTKPFYDTLHSFSRGDTGLLNLDTSHGIRARNHPECGIIFEVTPFVKPRRKSASGSQLAGSMSPSSSAAASTSAGIGMSSSPSIFGGGGSMSASGGSGVFGFLGGSGGPAAAHERTSAHERNSSHSAGASSFASLPSFGLPVGHARADDERRRPREMH